MKSLTFVANCIAVLGLAVPSHPTIAADSPVVVVRGPTVVAFFTPATEEELAKDSDTNEALADFQVYAAEYRKSLPKMGIEFHELYVHSFQLLIGKKRTTFRPADAEVGYYFVAPGRKPRVEYGVSTSIEEIARTYFGIPSK